MQQETKNNLIQYIRTNDNFFTDAALENYSIHELTIIKISIDTEKEKQKMKSSDILSAHFKNLTNNKN